MPNPPPPPPPGPPPPPMFAAPRPAADDGQARNMLLNSIRQGTNLKKTVTNDRSAPSVGGVKKSPPSGFNSRSNGPAASEAPRNNGGGGGSGPMDMSSLFAGGMPKLRSTGRNIGVAARSKDDSIDNVRSNNDSSPVITSHQKQKSLGSRREMTPDMKNRGPPPQPPPSNKKPTMHVSTSDTALTASSPSMSQRSAAPSLPSKPPVGGHGKPNFAPRPPGQYKTAPKPSPPPKSTNAMQVNGPPSLPSRPPSVGRAHSMRTPRSPSADSSPSPELGDYRAHQHFQSQEGLHHQVSNGLRKAAAPPPPPAGRNPPPPPPPAKAKPPSAKPPPPPLGSRVTPPVLPPPPPPTAAPPPPSSAPPPPATAPPLPPHRLTAAAAAAGQQKSQPPPPPLSVPPPPPVRNSSMRNGGVQANGEVEARFMHMFRKVHEFPAPEKFLNVPKVYNSRNDSPSSSRGSSRLTDTHAWDDALASKQQAPQPPSMHVQLSNKMWANDTSTC